MSALGSSTFHSLPGLIGALVLLGTTLSGAAAEQEPIVPQVVARDINGNAVFIEQFVAKAMRPFREADRNRDGLDADDVKALAQQTTTEMRAAQIAMMARIDLDRDGKASRAEVETWIKSNRAVGDAAFLKAQVDHMMVGDQNGDGFLNSTEFGNSGGSPGPLIFSKADLLSDLLAIDPNADGKLTAKELADYLRSLFARLDTNNDTMLDGKEVRAFQARQKEMGASARPPEPVSSEPACLLPKPAADDLIVALNWSEGGAMSTVSVAGPDIATSAVRLRIEAGERPVYLLLGTGPVIWQIEGAVERVSHVVLLGGTYSGETRIPGGVTGVPREKVAFLKRPPCRQYPPYSSTISAIADRAFMERALGRAPDVSDLRSGPSVVTMPHKGDPDHPTDDPAPAGLDEAVWREGVRGYWWYGLADIDPAKVVSEIPPVRYTLLPGYMGLAQLVHDGSLVFVDRHNFRVVKPIARFPTDPLGVYDIRFLLAKGVPVPPVPGRLCIVSEETGERLNPNGICHG